MPLLAHGLGGRSDLPVPIWLALAGGTAALLISFVALRSLWAEARLDGEPQGRAAPGWLASVLSFRSLRTVLRALVVAMLLLTLAAAVLGTNSSASNPSPTWFYVWFWVGIVPASLLLGPVWRVLNPLRSVSSLLARLSGDPDAELVSPLPERLGMWPAAGGLLAFVWVELVYPQAGDPLTVLVFIAIYALIHLVQGQRYGPDWYSHGDGFEAYSGLVGSLAPVTRGPDGRWLLQNPLRGLARLPQVPGLLAVIFVLLGSTAFDGLTRTDLWTGWTENAAPGAALAFGSLGLLGSVGFVAVTYLGVSAISARWLRDGGSRTDAAHAFAHSLIPIAIGYTVAHYFSLLVFQGQAGYLLATDPFGSGADLLGTAGATIDYTVVSPEAIALVQVGAIVVGHVVGVVAAHDRAMAVFPSEHKTVGQLPLLAAMVLYTVGGIALLVGS